MALEPLAVELFVQRATPEEAEALASTAQQLDPESEHNRDVLERFNQVLLAGCRNPILADMLGGLYKRIHALRRISATRPERVAAVRQEYSDLAEAVRSRSVEEATAAARRHVTAARATDRVAMELLEQDNE